MNETISTTQFMKDWQRQRSDLLWWFKIPDHSRPMAAANISGKRAVDVIACYNGLLIGMEWKLKKDKRAIPCRRVRINQIETLCNIEVAGGLGLLMIMVYLGPRDKAVYAIPIAEWNKQTQLIYEKSNRKSIRIEEIFPQYKMLQHQIGQYKHWDITLLKEFINNAKNRK